MVVIPVIQQRPQRCPKSTLAALFLRTGSRAVAVEGPTEDEVLAETFEISFRAVG